MRKVLVSGCFDMMHSGHIAFLKTAADFGQVYACIGSDETVFSLKGRYPIINQSERAFCLDALDSVFQARVSRGFGHLDFLPELLEIKPDIFIVNADGDSVEKRTLMAQNQIEYIVLDRIPAENLPPRSTTALRTICDIPYRLDLAGGWLDQPFVNCLASGPVITISVEPTVDFNHRSGMSSSTRKAAIELWKTRIPDGNRELLAKTLFCFENPPGTKDVAGSQDAIGLVYPGLNCIEYGEAGSFLPNKIETILDEDILTFLESRLWLMPLGEREAGYSVLENTQMSSAAAAALAAAAENLFLAATNKDALALGKAMTASFEAQIEMFPNMTSSSIQNTIQQYYEESPTILGHKLSGAGGGGYLVLFSEHPIDNTLQIKIRRAAN
ncbi:MAG: adenylyltransferase/cytidyltransferase family protein [Bacteroidetes bacterium]|nr:adenylyltransferase/cytidyltransferase family protein [Bacteroidota bacterium]